MTQDAPREGLPPCIRGLCIFEGFQACWHDMEGCPMPEPSVRHVITAGSAVIPRPENDCTEGRVLNLGSPLGPTTYTDDEAEAQAAWERARDWVGEYGSVRS